MNRRPTSARRVPVILALAFLASLPFLPASAQETGSTSFTLVSAQTGAD